MKDVMIEHLTWTDVEEAVASGIRRVVVCAASTEQHGPHLPLATDELLASSTRADLRWSSVMRWLPL